MATAPASDAGLIGIVLTDSPDVIDSIGRPGLLATRTGDPVAVTVEPRLRTDVLVQRLRGDREIPGDVPVGAARWLAAATSTAFRSAKVAAISLVAELSTVVYRHLDSGLLFDVGDGEPIDDETGRWLAERCQPVGPIDEQATAANLETAVGLLGADTRLVVYNLSTFVPDGDDIESAIAFADRAQRLDLALARAAGTSPILVVDVDRIVAELGAGDHVTAPGRYSAEAANEISEEAVAQIDALGVLDPMTSELALLVIPRYDRRTQSGSITRWYKRTGDAVGPGDVLFDIEFGGLAANLGATRDVKMKTRVMTLGVVAGDAGHLLVVSPTTDVSVGDPVAVVGARPDLDPSDTDELTPHFRVGLRVVER
ncbi:hypothetical protein BH24ACT7_BH24ACT7_08310 [soil metagenome]